ncbi:MAG: hypothetical protein V4722_11560 [Bacteroidota bacterium]
MSYQHLPLKERKRLASGYAVILAREGWLENDIVIQLGTMYALDVETAREVYSQSKDEYSELHCEGRKSNVLYTFISLVIVIAVLVMYFALITNGYTMNSGATAFLVCLVALLVVSGLAYMIKKSEASFLKTYFATNIFSKFLIITPILFVVFAYKYFNKD